MDVERDHGRGGLRARLVRAGKERVVVDDEVSLATLHLDLLARVRVDDGPEELRVDHLELGGVFDTDGVYVAYEGASLEAGVTHRSVDHEAGGAERARGGARADVDRPELGALHDESNVGNLLVECGLERGVLAHDRARLGDVFCACDVDVHGLDDDDTAYAGVGVHGGDRSV